MTNKKTESRQLQHYNLFFREKVQELLSIQDLSRKDYVITGFDDLEREARITTHIFSHKKIVKHFFSYISKWSVEDFCKKVIDLANKPNPLIPSIIYMANYLLSLIDQDYVKASIASLREPSAKFTEDPAIEQRNSLFLQTVLKLSDGRSYMTETLNKGYYLKYRISFYQYNLFSRKSIALEKSIFAEAQGDKVSVDQWQVDFGFAIESLKKALNSLEAVRCEDADFQDKRFRERIIRKRLFLSNLILLEKIRYTQLKKFGGDERFSEARVLAIEEINATETLDKCQMFSRSLRMMKMSKGEISEEDIFGHKEKEAFLDMHISLGLLLANSAFSGVSNDHAEFSEEEAASDKEPNSGEKKKVLSQRKEAPFLSSNRKPEAKEMFASKEALNLPDLADRFLALQDFNLDIKEKSKELKRESHKKGPAPRGSEASSKYSSSKMGSSIEDRSKEKAKLLTLMEEEENLQRLNIAKGFLQFVVSLSALKKKFVSGHHLQSVLGETQEEFLLLIQSLSERLVEEAFSTFLCISSTFVVRKNGPNVSFEDKLVEIKPVIKPAKVSDYFATRDSLKGFLSEGHLEFLESVAETNIIYPNDTLKQKHWEGSNNQTRENSISYWFDKLMAFMNNMLISIKQEGLDSQEGVREAEETISSALKCFRAFAFAKNEFYFFSQIHRKIQENNQRKLLDVVAAHNILLLERNAYRVTLETIQAICQLSSQDAKRIVNTLIRKGVLKGKLDDVSGFLHIERKRSREFDEKINKANKTLETIEDTCAMIERVYLTRKIKNVD